LLQDEKIPSLIVPGSQETRENMIVIDESNNSQYRFGMPMTSLTEIEWRQFLMHLENLENIEYLIISGSLPPEFPLTIFSKIAEIAKSKNARLIVDTKGGALLSALECGLYLIKPNLGELSSLVGKEKLHVHEIKNEARTLIDRYNCQVVVVSMGSEGAMLVTSDFAKAIKPPLVQRRSTVGAGDSMVAGIVLSLYNGSSLTDAVQYGVACGTAATLNPGTELCKKEDVEKLVLQLVTSEVD
jgi:6-phosphofructokinase 2